MFYSEWLWSIGKPKAISWELLLPKGKSPRSIKAFPCYFLENDYYCNATVKTIFLVFFFGSMSNRNIFSRLYVSKALHYFRCYILILDIYTVLRMQEQWDNQRRESEIQKFHRRMVTLGENMARRRYWIQGIQGTVSSPCKSLINDYNLTNSKHKLHFYNLENEGLWLKLKRQFSL